MKQRIADIINEYLIYSAVFLIPFYFLRFSVLGLKTNILEVFIFLAFLSTFHILLSTDKKPVFGPIWPYLFLLAALVSVFFAPDKTSALGIFKGWFLTPVTLYFLIINIFRRENLPKLALPLYLSFALVGIWGLLQSWHIIGLTFYQRGDASLAQYLQPANFRIFGPFESPNFLAMYLVPMFFIALLTLPLLKKLPKMIYILSAIPFGLAVYDLVLTGSRAGLIAFVAAFAGVILLGSMRQRGLKSKKIIIPLLTAAISLVLLIFASQTFTNRAGSDTSRLDIYRYSFQMIKQSPVAGIGLGNFQNKITDLSKGDTNFINKTLPYALHPHNIFLAMWLNLGLAGLIIFLFIVAAFFKRSWQNRQNPVVICLMAAMLAILIHGLFDTTYFKNDLSAIFFLLIALAQKIATDEREKSINE